MLPSTPTWGHLQPWLSGTVCAGGAQGRRTDPGVLTGTVLKGIREGKTHEDTLSIFRN